MPIRDLLKHKHRDGNVTPPARLESPQLVISQSDANTEEVLTATTTQQQQQGQGNGTNNGAGQLPPLLQRANSTSGVVTLPGQSSQTSLKVLSRSASTRLIPERFSMRRAVSSSHVPEDLPEITITDDAEGNGAEWERRATMLAWENEKSRSRSTSPAPGVRIDAHQVRQRPASTTFELGAPAHSPPLRPMGSSPDADITIQEAIRLHEAGDLERSTKMFGQLADPNGQNDALSQVLYGLALRYVAAGHDFCDRRRTNGLLTSIMTNAASLDTVGAVYRIQAKPLSTSRRQRPMRPRLRNSPCKQV